MPKAKLPFKEFKWSPKLAYVVGLLVTDGCLSNNGRSVILRSSDYSLLETFNKCLDIKNKIEETKSTKTSWAKKVSYRVQYGNIQFYQWLLSIGLTPAKTYTIGKIDVPDRYFRDFLRGHLDGDGSVFTYTDKYNHYKGKNYINTRVYTRFISASEKHISWLHKAMQRLSPVKGALLYRIYKREGRVPMWEIKFSKYESLKLLRWIYYRKTLPTLERKRKIAENLLKNIVNNKLVRMHT